MIDPDADRAVYRQIADDLRGSIASGHIGPAQWLPSVTRLIQEYGVGRETVRRALAVLVREGLVEIVPGRGTRVYQPPPRTPVPVPRGAQAISRRATSDERAKLDIPEGGHVQVVTLGGRVRGVYPADTTELRFA